VAIAMLQEQPGLTAEIYDAVNAKLSVHDSPPEGLILHTAGPTAAGGFRIFDVWESREAFDRFSQERLGPAIQEVVGGGDGPAEPPPPPEFYELHDVVKP
jgi:hypothetical protein